MNLRQISTWWFVSTLALGPGCFNPEVSTPEPVEDQPGADINANADATDDDQGTSEEEDETIADEQADSDQDAQQGEIDENQVLTISPNNAPTITSISNQTLSLGAGALNLNFTVSDTETGLNDLVVTAISSNPTLLPNENLGLSGSNGSYSLTPTPAAGHVGYSAVTLIVNDGQLVGATSFVFTVVNSSPIISTIAAQTLSVGESSEALSFTIADSEISASNLTVSATSNNSTLLPNAGLVLGGSGSSRSITISPAANQTGLATVVLTVSDGNLSASSSFVVSVENTLPSISSIANQTVQANQATGALAFTIGDAETATASLSLSATSSDTTLVPVSNIVFGGSGTNRTISVTPVANMTGFSTITIFANDGIGSKSASFVVTVTGDTSSETSTAPTISSINAQSLLVGQSSGALAFTVSDAETAAGDLIVSASSSNTTLLPSNGITLGGSGSNRTITLAPTNNQTGSSTLTLTVSDGTLTASTSFVLAVANSSPTITTINNQTVAMNGATGSLSFTVADTETSAASLSVTATSSNTTLVPNANVVFGGSGGSRTAMVTPAANASGSSIVTVYVSDGISSAATSFVVTITNSSPTVSSIATQSLAMGSSSGALAFTVSDTETSAGSLAISKASTNTTLIPLSGITLGGSGANRTVTVAPAATQVGTATVTLTVSDGELSAATSFAVTVTNTGPTISAISDQTVATGSSTAAIAFTVSDSETATGSLTLSKASTDTNLIPLAGIVLGGSDGNRTVTVTPANGQTGVAVVTITVSDGNASATSSFAVTVNPTTPIVNATGVLLGADKQTFTINGTGLQLVDTVSIQGQAASFNITSAGPTQVTAALNGSVVLNAGTTYTLEVESPTSMDTFDFTLGLDADSVIAASFFAGGVNTGDIASSSLATADFANGSVTTDKIADGSVTTSKIADGAVTNAKLSSSAFLVAETTRTINILATDTAADIQAKIDAVGKYIPHGITVTFQFANGTYALTSPLYFNGFFGGGALYVNGNTTETNALHTNQNVILNFNNNTNGLVFTGNGLYTNVGFLKITINSDTGQANNAIKIVDCTAENQVRDNYLVGNSTSDGYLLYMLGSFVHTTYNYFSNAKYAFYCSYASQCIDSGNWGQTNAATGTNPAYAYYTLGGITHLWSGAQISAGTTQTTSTGGGGTW